MELMEGYVIPVINEPMTLDRLDIGGLGYARFLLKKGGSLGICTPRPICGATAGATSMSMPTARWSATRRM